MSTEAHQPPADPDPRPDDAGPDYRLLGLAAIVPAIIIAAILIRVLVDRPHDSNAHPATLTVTVPAAAPAGGCGPPSSSALAAQGDAVEATATAVSGRTVTLQPKRVFKGQHYDRIQLELPAGTPPSMLRLPTFTDGATYLLAIAPDGSLSGCGLTGTESSSLERIYTAAFG